MEDLVGASDIAARLHYGRQAVHHWRARYPDFPAPAGQAGRAFVWHWVEVLAWAEHTGRASRGGRMT